MRGRSSEYGPLVIAAQRRRRTIEDLIANTPADGLVAGIGRVNGDLFGDEASRCIVMSYDYTVLAGTQGLQNHRKKDRMFELAEAWRLPIVFFTEGGGGRPGDTDGLGVAGLDCMAFNYFGRLSGLVPLVGITSGRCFAGNAALLGCCDVVIATEDSNIGMGGPAMIEGGGLGVFRPEEVGPLDVQVANGVVDIAVADEAEAVRGGEAVPVVLPGRGERVGVRRPAAAALDHPGESPARVRRAVGDRDDGRRGLGAGAAARVRARRWSRRWRASRGGRSASSPTTRCTWRARSTATARTRPRGSCSCATRSTCRCCSCATRRGSWWGRRSRRRRSCATRRGCS